MENESRQKKAAAAKGKAVKEEDPYGGSTDENTDAEAEQDHPIPELPGTSLFVLISVSAPVSYLLLFPRREPISSLPRQTSQTPTQSNWKRHTQASKCAPVFSVFFGV